MTDIVNKCEEAYSLIQKCQNNDSALVEEKAKIGRLVDEVSALMEKCELEPAETDNLTYYFEYDIAYTLENTIGQIRLLKQGQKGWFSSTLFPGSHLGNWVWFSSGCVIYGFLRTK